MKLILLMAVLLSGCMDAKRVPVELFAPPQLNNLTEVELEVELGECVSDATYIDVIKTYRRVKTLRTIIETTHK